MLDLPAPHPDGILEVMRLCRGDPREMKIDLGVGVYRDEMGRTPIMAAVKEAERRLWEAQDTKAYVGLAGDRVFLEETGKLLFGATDRPMARLQTPGGTGAIRAAIEFLHDANPRGRIFVGLPTWPNHLPIIENVGVEMVGFDHGRAETGQVAFDAVLAAIDNGRAGDAILLHGCCHNPSGMDYSVDQWAALARAISERGMVPIVDSAYHGLGDGLEEDVAGIRTLAAHCEHVLVGASCSKNMGLYRDRVGAAFYVTGDAAAQAAGQGLFETIGRRIYSMPPDHGGAVAGLVLSEPDLRAQWEAELDAMRARVNGLRAELARQAEPLGLSHLADQKGMFSLLPLSREAVSALARDEAIYMAPDGRINVAGLNQTDIPRLVDRLAAALID